MQTNVITHVNKTKKHGYRDHWPLYTLVGGNVSYRYKHSHWPIFHYKDNVQKIAWEREHLRKNYTNPLSKQLSIHNSHLRVRGWLIVPFEALYKLYHMECISNQHISPGKTHTTHLTTLHRKHNRAPNTTDYDPSVIAQQNSTTIQHTGATLYSVTKDYPN